MHSSPPPFVLTPHPNNINNNNHSILYKMRKLLTISYHQFSITVIKSSRKRSVGHGTRIGPLRYICKILFGHLKESEHSRNLDIEADRVMKLKWVATDWTELNWTEMSQDTVRCSDLVTSGSVKQGDEFLDRILKKGLCSLELVLFSLRFSDILEFCMYLALPSLIIIYMRFANVV
jgi:hypothetical protein